MKAILTLLAAFFLVRTAGASPIEGYWQGLATRAGETRPIALRIERSPQGLRAAYDIPSLSLEGIRLPQFAFDPATGTLAGTSGLRARLVEERIEGELSPMLVHGPPVRISLQRAEAPPPPATVEREISFVSRGFTLKGLLIAPARPGRHPALVSLHGSGPSTRWLALARARRFAAAGYAMLIYDKPGSGESEGDWTNTSLDEMAQDAIRAVDFLRTQPEVDPRRVGLWAHSQAGWIVSRASALSNHIAFALVLAGGGATPREVEEYFYRGALRRAGADPDATARAMAWVSDFFDYERTGQGYQALADRLAAGATEPWVRALGIRTIYPLPAQQPKWQWVPTYDPAADIRRMRIPLLLLFAAQDQESPVARSLAGWRDNLRAGGNPNVEWRLFPGADHHFLIPSPSGGWPSLAPDYYETQIDWLHRWIGR